MSQLNSTLFTGLSGLVTSQAELNVVGNNIANANTTAFKSSRVLFSPQFYVTESSGSPSTGSFGGTNPSQVGLGAQVAAVQQNFSQGELQSTGLSSDLGIDGDGFFVIKNASGQQLYTRNGAFSLNNNNQLVDTSGDFVMGYGVNNQFQIPPGAALAPITIPLGQETAAKATSNASLSGVLDASGTVASAASQLTTQALQASGGGAISGATLLTNVENFGGSTPILALNDTLTLTGKLNGTALPSQTFVVQAGSTVSDLESFLNNSMGVDTTPPAGAPGPTPGTSIVAVTGGGQALQLNGNVGEVNAISIGNGALTDSSSTTPFTFTDEGGANGESATTAITAYDSLGNPVTLNVNTVLTGQSSTGTTWQYYVTSPDNVGGTPLLSAGTLSFNTSGQLIASTGNAVTLNRTGTGATPSQQITLNFSGAQALSNTSSSLISDSQDGFSIGTLTSYAVGQNGIITGAFSNGLTETIGQVVVANFSNPSGLVNDGNNQYTAGADSGSPLISTPGANGTGVLQSGELEMSNVDLSQEFINLIIASTGYSANSRVISTSDQLLTELLNSQH